MAIVKESGWDNLSVFASTGTTNTISYTPPQTAFLAGKKNLALIFFGTLVSDNSQGRTFTASYGNCNAQVFISSSSGQADPNALPQHYDYCIFIPLTNYDGVSNTLTINSTLGFLSNSLVQTAANGGAGYALTLSNVDLVLNAAPLATAGYLKWINTPIPVDIRALPFTANVGDWLLHRGILASVNTVMSRVSPATGVDSSTMPSPVSGASAVSQASYTIAAVAGPISSSWSNPNATGSFGIGFNISALGFIVQDPIQPSIALAPLVLEAGVIVELEWTPTLGQGPNAGTFSTYDIVRNGVTIATGVTDTSYVDEAAQIETMYTYAVVGHYSVVRYNLVTSNSQSITTESLADVFNCDCEIVSAFRTLAELRFSMAVQCGYAAMAATLPAGQAIEFNEYLRTAQVQLYKKFFTQRTTRFFNWTMVQGLRYYGIKDSEGDCALTMDSLAVKWVGFEDLNKAWYRLVEGIPPEYYTRANINFGWPARYEIRSCIEIFPAPQAAYTLWVKADIDLAPFAVDADRTTIDDEAVLLFAIANWKSDKGKPGADRAMGQATARIQDLTARRHGTYRYVPATSVQNPATPPKFLPLGNQQS